MEKKFIQKSNVVERPLRKKATSHTIWVTTPSINNKKLLTVEVDWKPLLLA